MIFGSVMGWGFVVVAPMLIMWSVGMRCEDGGYIELWLSRVWGVEGVGVLVNVSRLCGIRVCVMIRVCKG